jgi:hypothetical protein
MFICFNGLRHHFGMATYKNNTTVCEINPVCERLSRKVVIRLVIEDYCHRGLSPLQLFAIVAYCHCSFLPFWLCLCSFLPLRDDKIFHGDDKISMGVTRFPWRCQSFHGGKTTIIEGEKIITELTPSAAGHTIGPTVHAVL